MLLSTGLTSIGCLALVILPLYTTAQHVVDLSGRGWTVKNARGNVTAPGSLPSQVHLDLYAAKVIGE
jgi:beta-mannosidase